MTLKEFKLTEENHFVALEYYRLILNRTYLVLLTKDYLVGIIANGFLSAEVPENNLLKKQVDLLVIRGDLSNPHIYLKEKYIQQVENENLFDGSILTKNKANFLIERKNILNASYNPKKKWGMSYNPHDGRVYIKTTDNKKREFMILGSQSGQKIADLILNPPRIEI